MMGDSDAGPFTHLVVFSLNTHLWSSSKLHALGKIGVAHGTWELCVGWVKDHSRAFGMLWCSLCLGTPWCHSPRIHCMCCPRGERWCVLGECVREEKTYYPSKWSFSLEMEAWLSALYGLGNWGSQRLAPDNKSNHKERKVRPTKIRWLQHKWLIPFKSVLRSWKSRQDWGTVPDWRRTESLEDKKAVHDPLVIKDNTVGETCSQTLEVEQRMILN